MHNQQCLHYHNKQTHLVSEWHHSWQQTNQNVRKHAPLVGFVDYDDRVFVEQKILPVHRIELLVKYHSLQPTPFKNIWP